MQQIRGAVKTQSADARSLARPSDASAVGVTRGGFLGLGLFRSPRSRVIGGVAGGIGELLGIDPVLVRVSFALLTLSGVAGVILYMILWAVVPEDDGRMQAKEPGLVRAVSMGLVVLGLMILLRHGGLWLGDTLAWSVGLAGLGVAVIWFRSDDSGRARWSRIASSIPDNPLDPQLYGRVGAARLLAGALLFAAGVATFVVQNDLLNAAPSIVFAVTVTVAGLSVLFGPWAWRLLRQLSDERTERIRSEERAEMAAHLHDSVLQTLALIQRTDQPREMVALARNQERELRAWLGGAPARSDQTLSGAIEAATSAVELQFKVPIDFVAVGDAPLDDRGQAVVEACREAAVNAAKHSGAALISVYLEVENEAITAYVRDQGAGFDPEGVSQTGEASRSPSKAGWRGREVRLRSSRGRALEPRFS
jgi:phage shock protein PspC (stress-responsive transcriptional regulator)